MRLLLFCLLIWLSCNPKNNIEDELKDDYLSGNYIEVIEKCDKILKTEESAIALNYRGNSYLKLGRYQESFNDFTKLYTLGDTSLNTIEGLGISSASLGYSDTAYRIFTKLIHQNKDSSKYFYYLALVCLDMSKDDDAVNYLKLAIVLEPTYESYIYKIALVLQEMGRYEESIAYFSKIINGPEGCNNDTIYYNRATSYSYFGPIDSSLLDLSKAISINNKHSDYYYYRAIIYMNKGEIEKCCSDFFKAQSLGYLVGTDDKVYLYCNSNSMKTDQSLGKIK